MGPAANMYYRYSRLGVWNLDAVSRATNSQGRVMALRFGDTEVLQAPLALAELEELYSETGERFTAPQSPRRVPERLFRLLYERTSAYAR